jgi:hypothetical protein
MLSFSRYINEALTKTDIALAKKNMAKIAAQVMAKQAKKKPARNSGIDWADMSGDIVTAWWHPTKQAHTFRWVFGKQHHVNELVKYPNTFGIPKGELQKAIEDYTEEEGYSRSSPTWKKEVEITRERFLDGSIDSFHKVAFLAYRRGWVQIRKSGMIRMDGEFAGPRRSIKALFRELLDSIDSSPRGPKSFGIDIYFDDKTQTRIRSREDIERLLNS